MSKEKSKSNEPGRTQRVLRKLGGAAMILVAPAALYAGIAYGTNRANKEPAQTTLESVENAASTVFYGGAMFGCGLMSAYLGVELFESGKKGSKDKAIMSSSDSAQKQKNPTEPEAPTPPQVSEEATTPISPETVAETQTEPIAPSEMVSVTEPVEPPTHS